MYELVASPGLHMLEAGFGLAATVDGPGGGGAVSLDETADSKAPLPIIGLRGLWRLSDKVYLGAQARFFSAEIDSCSGTLTDLKAQIVWQFTPRIGAGIGYNDFRLAMDELEDGRVAVFIPDAPEPRNGTVCFVSPERIRPLAISAAAAMKLLRRTGQGSGELLKAGESAATRE